MHTRGNLELVGRWWLAVLCTCALAGCPDERPAEGTARFEQALSRIVATCASTDGRVEVRRAGSTFWEPITPGATFRAGDWVRTGEDGALRVEFVAGGGIVLEPDAVAVVDALRPDGSEAEAPLVAVESGVVRGWLDGEGGNLHIRTADGSEARLTGHGDEGAEVRVARTEEGTEVALDQGEATLDWQGGEERLPTGSAAEIQEDGVHRVELLPPPRGGRPGDDHRTASGTPVRLRWPAVEEAAGYRIQLARDEAFREPLSLDWSRANEHKVSPEAAGVLYWRVASRDAEGRFGPWGAGHRLFVEAEAPEDLLLAPPAGARLGHPGDRLQVRFAWKPQGAGARYRLVVARGRDLSRRHVVDLELTKSDITVDTLRPGRYVWGVYRLDDGGRPLFLSPRRLRVRRATLEAPEVVREWGASGD